jgi:hypothetical protein
MPELATPPATTAAVQLEVCGLRVSIGGEWPEVCDAVRRDFAWFERPVGGPAEIEIRVERREPDFAAFGDLVSSFVTPRNVVYQQGTRTVIDYFGRALSILERDRNLLTVQGTDTHLVHEAVYLFLLSRIGEHLDWRRTPRLHALGLRGPVGGVAVMLPSGGGKSTLALRALRADGVTLISEDSPLIDRRGRLHPFPLRVGINESDAPALPPEHVRRIERMEFHPKLLVDIDYFRERIEPDPVPLRHLVIGRRSLAREPLLERMPRRRAVGPLIREAVIGVGLYQGMEFVLQHGMRDAWRKLDVAAMRVSCCAAGLARARVWELTLGRDHDRNWDALRSLLEDE